MLLTRDQFHNAVFERDGNKCVICGNLGADAHHIMERRLFDDGGYYLDNGATLCEVHHFAAEATILPCGEIRKAAGIDTIVLPPHLYRDEKWDKWGNLILINGFRVAGELFNDSSVQKVLRPILHLFVPYIKYPRTYHLPTSPGCTDDDRKLENTLHFQGKRVVITEKRDGENTSIYLDYVHARSISADNHPTKDWIKNFQAKIGWQLPDGWRICGENLWAQHSISYSNLTSFFEVFSIWDETNYCLGWDATIEWCELLELVHVPVLYDGIWSDDLIERFIPKDTNVQEGFVVRLAEAFHYAKFRLSVAKWVRPDHVKTSHNWKRQVIIRNSLRNS